MRGYTNCRLGAVYALAILSDGQVALGRVAAPVIPLAQGLRSCSPHTMQRRLLHLRPRSSETSPRETMR